MKCRRSKAFTFRINNKGRLSGVTVKTALTRLFIYCVSHCNFMDFLKYEELPVKIKESFKSKVEAKLIQDHNEMGLPKPQKWQFEEALEWESSIHYFTNERGLYYYFKPQKLGYCNGS